MTVARGPQTIMIPVHMLLPFLLPLTVFADPGQGPAPPLPSADTQPSLVVQWNAVLLNEVSCAMGAKSARCARPAVIKLGPPTVARALAVMHSCIYSAWAAYDSTAAGLFWDKAHLQRRPAQELTDSNKATAVSCAAYHALTNFFSPSPDFVALLKKQGLDDDTCGAGTAKAACQAVLDHYHDGSGSDNATAAFKSPNTPTTVVDPNAWQPLALPNANGTLVVQTFSYPDYYRAPTFAICFDELRPGNASIAWYGTPAYQAQVDRILGLSANLNDTTKMISEYWGDGPGTVTPPGHWSQFDRQVEAWGGRGKGKQLINGSEWLPYQQATFLTPPFPSFTSGHSTFSAAAAQLLALFTGSDRFGNQAVMKAGSSQVEPSIAPSQDIVLAWPTFTDAAKEAGMSRQVEHSLP
ncbi:hypothetical protein WJX72_007860 [[Myrmecia] bisecta]|uniref:Uncharacterized protein n=1 Tax=[Myrmecia] bisecta TaxID=41462 RepID=A0AAW1Q0A5_9CHLO